MSSSSLRFLLVVVILGVAAFFVASTLLTDGGTLTDPIDQQESTDVADDPQPTPVAPKVEGAKKAEVARTEVQNRRETPRGDGSTPTSGAGALAGTVVNPRSEPVANATVTLYQGSNSIAMPFPLAQRPTGHKTRTDDDGVYIIEGLAAADNYVVVVEHPEYAAGRRSGVVLREGDNQRVDEIRLTEGAKVTGIVRGNTGNPIPDATVELWNQMAASFQAVDERAPVASVQTDPGGKYEFRHVDFNTMEVVASAPGYATLAKTNTTLFSQIEDTQIDFDLEPALLIEGVVVDAANRAVINARIEAYQVGRPPNAGTSKGRGDSGNDGRFRIAGVSAGTYNLIVRARGFSDKQHGSVEAGANDIRITLEPRGVIAGRVVGGNGGAVTKFTVRLKRRHGDAEPVPTGQSQDFRSPDGTFEFDDLDPGDYVAEAEAEGYAPTDSAPFAVERGVKTTDVVIALSAGATLTGTVVNQNGEPVKGARVTIRQNNFVANPILEIFRSMPNSRQPEDRTAITGPDGVFRLAHLVAGRRQVEVAKNGFSSVSLNDIDLMADQTRDLGRIGLSMGGSILGRCYDANGRPFSNGSVNCVTKDGFSTTTRPDQNGNFEFRSLGAGEYTLSLHPDQIGGEAVNPFLKVMYSSKTEQKVQIVNDRTHEVNLRLPPPQGN